MNKVTKVEGVDLYFYIDEDGDRNPPKGTHYKGEFLDGKFHGKGTLTGADSS